MKGLLIGAIAALLGVLFILVVVLVRLAQPPEAPLHYTQAEYLPDKPVYTPGDTMTYSPTLVLRSGGRIDVLRSFWSRNQDRSATICSGQSAPVIQISRNLPAGSVGDVRGGARVRIMIPDLPPGDYWLLSSAVGPDGGQSLYQVPFSVKKECG